MAAAWLLSAVFAAPSLVLFMEASIDGEFSGIRKMVFFYEFLHNVFLFYDFFLLICLHMLCFLVSIVFVQTSYLRVFYGRPN